MTKKLKFSEAVNWEWVHAHHPLSAGKVSVSKNKEWIITIIVHANRRGCAAGISYIGAARIINQNLY